MEATTTAGQPIDLTVRGGFSFGRGPGPLWEDLATAADALDPALGGRGLADRINAHPDVRTFTLAISRALYGIVEQVGLDPVGAAADARRLSELIVRLRPAILAAALRAESGLQARRDFLRDAARVLTIPAVLRLAFAASAAYEYPLSPALRALLRKLAVASLGPAGRARDDAESVVRGIVGGRLEVAPPSAASLAHPLEPVRGPAGRRAPGRTTPEPDRLVQTALETGATGPVLWAAVSEMVESDRWREVLALLKTAPPGPAAIRLTQRIATPTALQALLAEEPVDFETLDLLLEPMGIAAAKPLLEHLAESRSRATRRGLLERVGRLGPDIAPLAEARLRDSRWFVVRNMLAVLREAGAAVSTTTAGRFLQHPDPRVRREAVLLALQSPPAYEEALVAGLADADRAVLRTALQAARGHLPDRAVPALAERVGSVDFPPEFRVMALHLLARSRSVLAVDALLPFVRQGSSLLGRPKLAPASPEMLAALAGLARLGPADRRVRAVLDAARRSRDARVLAVLHHVEGAGADA
jgi:hypothetical protein